MAFAVSVCGSGPVAGCQAISTCTHVLYALLNIWRLAVRQTTFLFMHTHMCHAHVHTGRLLVISVAVQLALMHCRGLAAARHMWCCSVCCASVHAALRVYLEATPQLV